MTPPWRMALEEDLRDQEKEMEKSIIRFIRKNRRPQIAKAILSKMSNAGGYYNTRLQVILWNHSNKTRMVLAQKQVLK
jgi:hypothetical protein